MKHFQHLQIGPKLEKGGPARRILLVLTSAPDKD